MTVDAEVEDGLPQADAACQRAAAPPVDRARSVEARFVRAACAHEARKESVIVSIGTGVVLFVIGAILAFAVNVQVAWVDLHLVGYILMGAGVVVFLIGIILLARKRSSVSTTRTVDSAGREQVTSQRAESNDPDVY
jgi:uncharacterized membrane protein